jgi:hypothetical protein
MLCLNVAWLILRILAEVVRLPALFYRPPSSPPRGQATCHERCGHNATIEAMKLLCSYGDKLYVAAFDKVLSLDLSVAASGAGSTSSLEEFACPKDASGGHPLVSLAISSDGTLLIGAYENKCCCCWNIATRELTGSIILRKRPTSIVSTHFFVAASDTTRIVPASSSSSEETILRRVVVATDKAGDIWGIDLPNLSQSPVNVGGHTASVLTDLAVTGDCIVSADRDEKIRVTKFPSMSTIQSYCLGHTSVVTSVAPVVVNGRSLLLSTSWDHRLILWDYCSGSIILDHSFRPATASSSSSSSSASSSLTAAAEGGGLSTAAEGEGDEEEDGGDEVSAPVDLATVDAIDTSALGDMTEEDLVDKLYDEKDAGTFPWKVVAACSRSLIAVIFKGSASVHIYTIHDKGDSCSLSDVSIIELADVPCDIIFSSGDSLLVALLPKPHYAQCIHIAAADSAADGTVAASLIDQSTVESTYPGIMAFSSACQSLGKSRWVSASPE